MGSVGGGSGDGSGGGFGGFGGLGNGGGPGSGNGSGGSGIGFIHVRSESLRCRIDTASHETDESGFSRRTHFPVLKSLT
jgi:hypothetical protein